jgi:hypothetical protein
MPQTSPADAGSGPLRRRAIREENFGRLGRLHILVGQSGCPHRHAADPVATR